MSEEALEIAEEKEDAILESPEDDDDVERQKSQEKALDAAFHLAMTVRCYFSALDPHDPMLRLWVLRQLERELPQLATEVLEPIITIENIDWFAEHCYPRV